MKQLAEPAHEHGYREVILPRFLDQRRLEFRGFFQGRSWLRFPD